MECLQETEATEAFRATVTVCGDFGLHARPAANLAKLAQRFESDIFLRIEDRSVDAKSILDILTLAAARHARVELTCLGADAREAGQAIAGFFSRQ